MKLIIIDDQLDVVDGIKNGVNWELLRIDELSVAFDADMARRIFSEAPPDIMLCDIEMPRENGLKLFAWVRRNYPETECIFLTSHADFEYAREAIHLGSFDYILQPATYEQIEAAVSKAINKILEKRREQQLREYGEVARENEDLIVDNLVRNLILGYNRDYDNIFENFQKMKFAVDKETLFCPMIIQILKWKSRLDEKDQRLIGFAFNNILSEMSAEKGKAFMMTQLKDYEYVPLFYGSSREDAFDPKVSQVLEDFVSFCLEPLKFSIAIYVGEPVPAGEIPKQLERLQRMEKDNVTSRTDVFYLSDAVKNTGMDFSGNVVDLPDMERLGNLLRQGHVLIVRDEIYSYIQEMVRKNKMTADILLKFHQSFMQMIMAVMSESGHRVYEMFRPEFSYDDYIKAAVTVDDMMTMVDYMLDYMRRHTDNLTLRDMEQSQFEKARSYIRANLDKNLSRTEIARQVYLSPDYLTRLFKKETGYLLKDYVLMEKMKLAKSLLVESDFSISIIASKVGYVNFSHFTQTFKKLENMTPQEYRQTHRRTSLTQ